VHVVDRVGAELRRGVVDARAQRISPRRFGVRRRCRHEADERAIADVAAQAQHLVAGERFDAPHFARRAVGELDFAAALARHGLERAHRPTVGKAPGELARCVDGAGDRGFDELLVVAKVRPVGSSPDAAGVKQLDGRREDIGPLEEEGTLLGEEGLVAREVEHHLIGFDLGKVRIQREIEGEIVGGVPLEIEPRADARRRAAPRQVRSLLAPFDLAEHEGAELERRARGQSLQAVEPAVIRDLASEAARKVRPLVGLLPLGNVAPGLKLPRLLAFLGREAQDVERDLDFGRPPVKREVRLGFPILVAVLRLLGVVVP
jgi:hypothetical protein